jgi:hypothetical protein
LIAVASEKEDMKFKIYLKDPDGISDSVHDASRASVNKIPGLSNSEREVLIDFRIKEAYSVLEEWCEYGDAITLEIDTDERTATVLPKKG